MHQLWRGTLAVVILALWVAPARPQPRHVPEGGAIHLMLLRQKAVQQDIKLSEEEIDKIHDFSDKQWKKAQEVHKLPEDEQHQKFAAMAKENEEFLRHTLKPEHRKRLNQITMQVAGLLVVTRPRVAQALNLTDEQKQKAKQLQKEARREAEEVLHSTSIEKRREKLRELRETSRKRLQSLLTDEQKEKWKEMSGPAFKGHDQFRYDPPLKPSK